LSIDNILHVQCQVSGPVVKIKVSKFNII